MTNVSIIIVNYNTVDYLRECLSSIYTYSQETPEVIVVDNASQDGSCEMVRNEFPQVSLIQSPTNLGFGVANNLGVTHATKPYVLLFNSDAYLITDTPKILTDYLDEHPDVSCVCPRVVLPKTGVVQAKTFGFRPALKNIFMQCMGLNRIFPKYPLFQGTDGDFRWAKEMEVGWVSGVCMCIRKHDYVNSGGFDTRFFMYCEDVELCMKLAKYGKIVLYDTVDIVHYGGASSKTIAARVRNAVLQQRHLLIIIQEYFGTLHYIISWVLMLLGQIIRLAVATLSIPKKGWVQHETLHTTWARTLDLIRIVSTRKVSK